MLPRTLADGIATRLSDVHRGDGRGGARALMWMGSHSEDADDVGDGVALDELALAASRRSEGGGGDAVDVAQAPEGGLVDHGDSIGGEEVAVAADRLEAEGDVVGGVLGDEGVNGESVVNAGVEAAVAPERHAVIELGEAHQDQREEGA